MIPKYLHSAATEAKDDGGGDNWSCKTCKAPVKSSPLTNQHPAFTGRMPFLLPSQKCQRTEWKSITFHGLVYPKLTWGSSILVLTIKGSWGRVANPLVSPLMPVPIYKLHSIHKTKTIDIIYVHKKQADQHTAEYLQKLQQILRKNY